MIKVRVPATSANLGPGFDCLGIAFQIYNTFEVEEAETSVLTNVDPRFNNDDNLFLVAYRRATGKHIHATFHDGIPISRGLGSSAALISAGVAAQMALSDTPISRDEAFQIASDMEGHPDNAAPCIYGGLTASLKTDNGYMYRSFPVSPDLKFTVLIPDYEVSTEEARKILPASYPRSEAAANAAHCVFMLDALESGDLEQLKIAAVDYIHEPYRSKLIPHFNELKDFLRAHEDGVLLISGSGSTCLWISKTSLSHASLDYIHSLPENWDIIETNVAWNGIEKEVDGQWLPII